MFSVKARLLPKDGENRYAAPSALSDAPCTEECAACFAPAFADCPPGATPVFFPTSFLQSRFWTDFKAAHGWQVLRFELSVLYRNTAEAEQTAVYELSVLIRRFTRFFSIAYIPMGPEAPKSLADKKTITVFWEKTACALTPFLPENTLYLRFDPPVNFYSLTERTDFIHLLAHPLVKAPADIQPPDTVILDLSLSEKELSARMKPKWRYNIRLAEKKGVTIQECGENGIDTFYALYEQTAWRDGIAVHTKDYYRSLLRLSQHSSGECTVRLYLAEHEGEALAALIALFSPREAVYLYGASSDTKRNLMSTYLLQWTVVCEAKRLGCATYDFYGIPPTDDENHPMHGLYRFKTGFGGKTVHRPGSIDIPLSVLYSLFRQAERLRFFYHKRIKKLFVQKR